MQKPNRLPVVREDGTIEIHLTQGHIAIVDWADAWVCGFNWSAGVGEDGRVYAVGGGTSLHREVAGCQRGDGMIADHKDGDTLNCRRSNIRKVTAQINTRNRRKSSSNTSGHTGVQYTVSDGRWAAYVGSKCFGRFKTKEEAVAARLAAERALWGVEPQRLDAHFDTLPGMPETKFTFPRQVDGIRRAYVARKR